MVNYKVICQIILEIESVSFWFVTSIYQVRYVIEGLSILWSIVIDQ